jgi:hypothetical protein
MRSACRNFVQRLQKHRTIALPPKHELFHRQTTTSIAQPINYLPEENFTFNLSNSTDTDGDGYTDEVETLAGTDINDSADFPVSLFNVFNGV